MKPVIGVSSYIKYHAQVKKIDFDATITQQDVLNALFKADALPVIIPISDKEDIKDYVENIDALVMQGGADVDPLLYGEEPSLLVTAIDPHRDRFEIAMIKEAWKQKKPILGICRGLQILNTAMGGTLYQDLSYYEGLKIKHSQTTPMHYPTHTVTLDEDSFLGRIMGKENKINTLHHQGIKDLADDFRPTAWSKDGVIEAIESKDKSQKTIAVQWHPEVLAGHDAYSQEIFNRFVELVKK